MLCYVMLCYVMQLILPTIALLQMLRFYLTLLKGFAASHLIAYLS